MKSLIIVASWISLLIPLFSFANGGDQRIVENKYFINLSRAPFTPRVGIKTSLLASFMDIRKNNLISDELVVRIRISKLGMAGSAKREFLFEQDNIKVQGGVLEFSYTFVESGLHEIFFDFAFASDPKKFYEVPDFLMDVQKPEVLQQSNFLFIIMWFVGTVLGLGIGLFLRKFKRS